MAEIVAETERLRLRTWDDADLDAFILHTNTPAVMRWLGGVWPREQQEAAYTRVKSYERDFGHTFWIVERKDDGALLGFCGLKRVNSGGAPNPGDFEIGWRLREDAWGHGYAKEAAIAAMDLAFDRYDAPFVVALTVDQNISSVGLMKRLGMKRRTDLDFVTTDAWAATLNPVIVYSMDPAQWPAARAAALA
ncbi:GNAT family N-acetyltransferase [Sphingomonas sinipercae]|uniref:GNAT family N-acetyltransferase n=1 Tax=Sphingomonas sinipercae TaxID=2714944 RepID=A0A6G7ZMF6_9SPHN|nr:GNAT family N-acetyltransferase [Sphingomonas sinipercae]QIL02099.1 GNAT family N-acetyltransferase [Sphingomonas sinipercae]